MIHTQQITEWMISQGIRFDYQPADLCDRWTIVVPDHGVIEVTLNESSEDLLFRTGPIVDLRDEPSEVAARVLRNAMDANGFLQLGRFVGVDAIYFEVPLSFPGDSMISVDQFMHALMVTIGNLHHGRSTLGIVDEPTDDELPDAIRNRLYPRS